MLIEKDGRDVDRKGQNSENVNKQRQKGEYKE